MKVQHHPFSIPPRALNRRSTPPEMQGNTQPPSDRVQLSKPLITEAPQRSSLWRSLGLAGLAVASLAGLAATNAAAVPAISDSQSMSTATVHGHQWKYDPVGRVESDGTIHDHQYRYSPIGRMEDDGVVHDHQWSYKPIGRVEGDGVVHNHQWSYKPIGRVEADGTVHGHQWKYDPIGRVEGNDNSSIEPAERAGAALLLLLND